MGTRIRTEFTTAVAGVSHYQDAVSTVRTGDTVDIRPEPDNPYDSNALGLYAYGNKIGYVPAAVAQRLETATHWTGEIREVLHGPGVIGLRVHMRPVGKEPARPAAEPSDQEQAPSAEGPSAERGKTMTAVYARSGRHLGSLIKADAVSAQVQQGSKVVTYPLDLVDIGRGT